MLEKLARAVCCSFEAFASCSVLVACAAAPAGTALPAPPASSSTVSPVAARPSASVNPEPALPAPTPLPPLDVSVVRVLEQPVSALVLGDGTRIAVLSEPPQVGDERGLHPIPLPASLHAKPGESERLGIFFGRDYEPRVMGQRQTSAGETAIYWRHLPNGWRDGREEIGQLGGTVHGALWGVLGTADPELVCRVGAVCIIKRQSGWTTAPAGDSQRIVTLQDGVLWGLDATGIAGIDKRGWALAIPAPTWSAPSALWATRGEAWVSTPSVLYHYQSGQWQSVPSPIGEVKAFWGTRPDSIWLAGSAGAAHWDGQRFRSVPVTGPLRVVRGRSDTDVWFGGDAGLFRVTGAKP